MPWFVLYTKSRNEKLVASKLRAKDIDVYCPLIKTERKWSDRKKVVEIPLFRSYCFVNIAEKDRSKVFDVLGVVRYLYWLKKPAVVRDEEIEAIKLMLNKFDHSQLIVTKFQPGDQAIINSGYLSGIKGEVLWQQGKTINIRLESLQIAVSVDMSNNIIMS